MSNVPEDAEELAVDGLADPVECIGLWRGRDGSLYVAGHHFGPCGEAFFMVRPDGSVESA